ncbi:unnamed protein product [Prorocentrum cordatum]|uniref:Uncharacterized protein n=1 Tax=Prorocentrum cordatum TaxID=2364126 RepID=A0ABN9YHS3_9DINO|nr:unnamed protein product [Polarella glacialis]
MDDNDFFGFSPGKGDGLSPPMDICGLCDKEDTLANLCCFKKGLKLHRARFNGIRAHDSFVGNGAPEQVQEVINNEFKTNRPAWKARVLPWVKPEQRDDARAEAKAKYLSIQDTIKKETNKELDDDLSLALVQFQAFHGFWNRMSDEDCEVLFWKKHKEQGGGHDTVENGEKIAKVKEKDIQRTRNSKGVTRTDSTAKITTVSEDDYENKRRRITSKRAAPSAGSTGGPSASAAPSTIGYPTSYFSESEGPASPAQSILSAETLKLAPRSHEAAAADEEQDKKSTRSGQSRRGVEINIDDKTRERKVPTQSEINDTDAVRFMNMKKLWRHMAEHVSKGFQDPSNGFIKQLTQESARVDAAMERDLPITTDELKTKLKTMCLELDKEIDNITQATKGTFLKVTQNLEEKMKGLEKEKDSVMDQLAGFKFISTESKDKSRKEYMQHYNRALTIQKRLIKGQFQKEVAAIWSRSLYAGFGEDQKNYMLGNSDAGQKEKTAKGGRKVKKLMLQCEAVKNSDPIDFEKVGIWTAGPFCDAVKNYMEKLGDTIHSKIEGIERAFDERGSNWLGCLGRLNISAPEDPALSLLGDGYFDIGTKDCVPWLCTVRADAFRHGPSAFPLNGYSNLVVVISEVMQFVLLPVANIISQGIILADVPKFLASEGATTTLEAGYLVTLAHHETLYVPYGFIALPLYYPATLDESKKSVLGHCMVLPLLHQQRMKAYAATNAAVTKAVNSSNMTFLSNQPQQMYKDRAAGLSRFHNE